MNLSTLWTQSAEQYRADAARWTEEAELVLAIELDGDLHSTGQGADYFRKYHAHVLELARYALELAEHCEAGAEASEKARTAHRNYLRVQGLVALNITRKNLAQALDSLNTRDYSPSTQQFTLDRLAHFITSQGPPRGTDSKHGASRVMT